MEQEEYIKLKNQLCFPLYASSRLVIRMYQPLLKRLDLTYPQYLIMLVLWENDNLAVNQICEKLFLETSSVTPLLKRMESKDLLKRIRSKEDERSVIIQLTGKGTDMKQEAVPVPQQLIGRIAGKYPLEKAIQLRDELNKLIKALVSREA